MKRFLYSRSCGRIVAAVPDELDCALVFSTLEATYRDLRAMTGEELCKTKGGQQALGRFYAELHAD